MLYDLGKYIHNTPILHLDVCKLLNGLCVMFNDFYLVGILQAEWLFHVFDDGITYVGIIPRRCPHLPYTII